MDTELRSDLDLPRHPEVPFETQHAVREQFVAHQLKHAKRVGKAGARAVDLARQHREALVADVGERTYKRLRAQAREARDGRRGSASPIRPRAAGAGAATSAEARDRSIERRREAARASLTDAGVDRAKARRISAAYGDRLAKLVPSDLRADVDAVLDPGHGTPPPPPGMDPIRYDPPYFGSSWYDVGYLRNFTFDKTLHLDKASGFVGHRSRLVDTDAGDFDGALVDSNSSVGVWYQMPKAGLLEVNVYAIAGLAHHELSLEDEFWSSTSRVDQTNSLSLLAGGGPPDEVRLTQTSYFHVNRETDGWWSEDPFASGTKWTAHMYSGIAFPALSWVWVAVGTQSQHFTYADDVEVKSELEFRWSIHHFDVVSTGTFSPP